MDKFLEEKGIFVTSAFFLLGVAMIGLTIGIAVSGYFYSQTSIGLRYLNEARFAAESGLDDGALRVVYNKNCPDINCPSSYSLNIGAASVAIEICKDVCSGVGKTDIISSGSVFGRVVRLHALLDVDSITGKVHVIKYNEL